MSLLPDRMKTVKVVIPVDYSRNLLRFLSTTDNIDIIDVQKKPFDINSYEYGNKIRELKEDFDRVIEHFEMKEKLTKAKSVNIDDSNFGNILKKTEALSNDIIKNLRKIDDRIILAKQELEKNKSVIEIAKNLIPFGISFQDLDDESPYFQVVVGRMESKRIPRFKWNLDAVTDSNYLFKDTSSDKTYAFIAIGYLERYQEEINRLFVAYGFEKFSIPERITGDPAKVVERSQKKIEYLNNKIKELEDEASTLIKEHGPEILAFAEQLEIEKNYLKITNMMRVTKRNISLWGWVPEKKMKSIKKKIVNATEKNAIIEFSKPVFEESEYPTKTSVPKFARIYDGLVSAYGVPGYNEFNSAILLQIFFPIMFGIMFADVGHGLLFTLLGVYGLTLQKKRVDTSSFIGELKNYFKGGAMLMIVSGIAAMFFGVLFGSYFGVTYHTGANHTTDWIPEPIWFSPEHGTHNGASVVIIMLELSLIIGMVHMTIGYVLRFINNIRHKHYAEAFLVTVMWTIFHWGLFILVFSFGTNFMTWFDSGLSGTFDMALFSIGGSPIQFFKIPSALWFFVGAFAAPMLVMSIYLLTHGIDGLAELLELLLSTLSNTVSYARIFAMNAVHGALSHIFTLVDFTGGDMKVMNYIGVAIGSLVILALEGLFSFIQTLRLQWVEFFAKVGYQGTGFKFETMAIKRIYSKSK
jgi:V/A-type H+-transporting ATPase subunit I